jgi:ribosome-associated protein
LSEETDAQQTPVAAESAPAASQERAVAMAQAALAGKAQDLILLHVTPLTSLADFFLVCSGNSDRHVRAIAERVEEAGRELGCKPLHREGERSGRWVLLDYGDVVVHVFDPPTREFYDFVQLWADAPRLTVEPLPAKPLPVAPDELAEPAEPA